jgi:hypothetical protein
MDRVTKTSVFLLSALFSTSPFAYAKMEGWGFKPNFGVDVSARHQGFEPGFGDEQFRHNYPGTNFYVGALIHKYLGIEGGYEHMYSLQKREFYNQINTNATVLGFFTDVAPPGIGNQLYFSEASTEGWHINLVGLWPICDNTALTASVGVAWSKMYLETVFVAEAAPPGGTRPTRWHSDDRALARLTLGARHMFTHHFGMRLQGAWENTSKLESTIPVPVDLGGAALPSSTHDSYTVKPHNSYELGLGVFLQFC